MISLSQKNLKCEADSSLFENKTTLKKSDIQLQALAVLKVECEGIQVLSQIINDDFERAVSLIYQTQGRIIISGMGKCSHIANKIAATFASTGKPAFFVHPAEASHGDLGMITPQDSVIMLSNSGETAELANLISYTHRFSIPLISIVGRAESTLAKMSTIALVLPKFEEACLLKLAPTTSTTMMLALGDALAICLLKKKGFTPKDFKIFHPGGNLGSQLLKVGEKMHPFHSLPLVLSGSFMQEALLIMTEKGFGCLGVLDSNSSLIGVVTDGDLRRHMSKDLLTYSVEKIMTQNPAVVTEDVLMADALNILNKKEITSLFVVGKEKKPLGLIHIHDFLRAGII